MKEKTVEKLIERLESQGLSIEQDEGNEDVVINGTAKFEESSADDGLMAVHLRICHDGDVDDPTRNWSFTTESLEGALPSLANRPILGHLHKMDGEWQFGGHDYGPDGEGGIEYEEIPIGVIPGDGNMSLVKDEETGLTFIEADGVIFEDYSKAAKVIEREGECAVSMEVEFHKYSFDAAEKKLIVNGFGFIGVTTLGVHEDGTVAKPAMTGASITKAEMETEQQDATQGPEAFDAQQQPAMVRSFELSQDDVRCALYHLIAEQEASDGEWYYINRIYDTYFEYEGWNPDNYWRQSFVRDGDVISLSGERVHLNAMILTDDEKAAVDAMQSNYELLEMYKADHERSETEARRAALLSDERFAPIATTNEDGEYVNAKFADISAKSNDMTPEELEKMLLEAMGEYAIAQGKFEVKKSAPAARMIPTSGFKGTTPKKMYGNIFDGEI